MIISNLKVDNEHQHLQHVYIELFLKQDRRAVLTPFHCNEHHLNVYFHFPCQTMLMQRLEHLIQIKLVKISRNKTGKNNLEEYGDG